jgi:hypothetical protein
MVTARPSITHVAVQGFAASILTSVSVKSCDL